MSFLSYLAVGLSPGGLVHASPRKVLKRTALGLALVAGFAVAADAGHDYWKVGRFLQSTTNAYIRADYTVVSPKITGHITEVLVQDNEPVTASHVVARVDDRDFKVALAQATADVASDDAELTNLDAQIDQQQSAIEQEKAEIAVGKASLSYAEADNVRYGNLKKSGYGTVQRAEKAQAAMRQKTALLQKSRAGLLMAQRKLDILASERAKAQAQRDRSLAAVRQAELNLSYTSITAAVAGVVGARSLRVGQYVQAGTPLMAVVPLDAVYIVANYKETQLTHVLAGQPVEIEVDSFPGVTLKGHVDSVSPASGLEFALLPADNATGNFTKIVQRVPVKIVLDEKALAGRLRPGMSVEATVDTRARH
ncbi:MAG TPA: HlyD family secretion protein [Reyranella sp.]|jgi:membrane fusion protein (multidrug efflux system)|nr:HlyD family secretion protein [Reyranella sp.]